MTNPQNPKDPNSLSLAGSTSGGEKKADFSNVQGHVDTVPDTSGGSGGTGGKADFSNVVGKVDGVPDGGGAGAGEQSYTVQKGDTLSHIAQKHYGKASKWHAIFDANRDQLEDPDKIFPGQVLKLPDANG
jgi:nucleoid-associated protein YgaU